MTEAKQTDQNPVDETDELLEEVYVTPLEEPEDYELSPEDLVEDLNAQPDFSADETEEGN